jgi:transcriptional regulator with XRE-family HTH domain
MAQTDPITSLPPWAVALRLALEAHGLSQGAFERKANLSKGACTRWLQGTQTPRMEHLSSIQELLGIDLTNKDKVARYIAEHSRPLAPTGTDGV